MKGNKAWPKKESNESQRASRRKARGASVDEAWPAFSWDSDGATKCSELTRSIRPSRAPADPLNGLPRSKAVGSSRNPGTHSKQDAEFDHDPSDLQTFDIIYIRHLTSGNCENSEDAAFAATKLATRKTWNSWRCSARSDRAILQIKKPVGTAATIEGLLNGSAGFVHGEPAIWYQERDRRAVGLRSRVVEPVPRRVSLQCRLAV